MPLSAEKLVVQTQQGVGSTTWTRPPFYGPLTIPELFAFHAEKSPDHPVIVYDEEDGGVRTLYHKDVFRGIRKAAKIMSDQIHPSPALGADSDGNTVVGILAVADTTTFLTLLVAIMYLGHTAFPLSTRNSAVAVAHLIRKTSVRQLVVSRDAAMQRLAQEAKDQLAKEGYDVDLLPMPGFGDIYNDDNEVDIEMGRIDADKPAFIIHSSGSTSFPKPIPTLHRHFSRWIYVHSFGDYDLAGMRTSFHGLPLFHVMGVFSIPWILGTGTAIAVFRPSSPPIAPTPENVLAAVRASNCDGMLCVPSFLEVWARESADILALRKLKWVLYAGAPLGKQAGTTLVQQGVQLTTGFGATETGPIVRYISHMDKIPNGDWEYFTLCSPVEYARIYQKDRPDLFELVVLDSPTWSPNVFNTEIDGRPAYATSDLFEEHPVDPQYIRVYGRVDDQIILSTGEKTNPIPMEAIMLQDPNIAAVIMFGRARVQNGVIVQPKVSFDSSDEAKLEAFRNEIWPTIERANNFAPSHSRIFKEMIAVTKPSKPFRYTAKGTPRRQISLSEYAEEIDELYKKVEESSQVDVPPPPTWTDETVRTYVRGVVKRVLNAPEIGDEDDLFQQGSDSLQATWIRNTILHAVRTTTKLSVHDVPLNFVYTNPTIAALGAFLHRLLSGQTIDKDAERALKLAQVNDMLKKYGTEFPTAKWASSTPPDERSDTRETVLITGTTGRLGSQLLLQLLESSDVARVYALNRGSSKDTEGLGVRQREAFNAWGLDARVLSPAKVTLLSGDLAKPSFGLEKEIFEELRVSVTRIIQNGWRVDFNVSLPSFEPLIAGARNLLDFSLSSSIPQGPKVLFVSSISALYGYAADEPARESLDFGPEVAVGLGYGESKWVTEQMFGRAARETGLRATSVRVGQLSGDSRVGGWNVKEWVPAIVGASQRLGCVPERDDTVSWVPIDVAASALVEMLDTDEPVLHLTSPRSVSWNDVFEPIAARLALPLVPHAEWLEKLRESARAVEETRPQADGHDSAHALIDFFEMTFSAKEIPFSTEKAVKASRSLANLGPLGKEDALRWLSFWESIGFLKA